MVPSGGNISPASSVGPYSTFADEQVINLPSPASTNEDLFAGCRAWPATTTGNAISYATMPAISSTISPNQLIRPQQPQIPGFSTLNQASIDPYRMNPYGISATSDTLPSFVDSSQALSQLVHHGQSVYSSAPDVTRPPYLAPLVIPYLDPSCTSSSYGHNLGYTQHSWPLPDQVWYNQAATDGWRDYQDDQSPSSALSESTQQMGPSPAYCTRQFTGE
jgi:hypothetical protein